MPWNIAGQWISDWNTRKYPVYSIEQTLEAQRRLVEDTTLPVHMTDHDKEQLIKAGVVFGQIDQDDPIFQFAQLPPDWSKQATLNRYYTWLLDNNGAVRAMIYYYPAFFALRATLYHV